MPILGLCQWRTIPTRIPARETALKPDPLDPERDKDIIAELKKISDAAKTGDPNARLSLKEASFMTINRTILRRKGKWQRVPDDV
jgi:hypothetical protein